VFDRDQGFAVPKWLAIFLLLCLCLWSTVSLVVVLKNFIDFNFQTRPSKMNPMYVHKSLMCLYACSQHTEFYLIAYLYKSILSKRCFSDASCVSSHLLPQHA
jgi:hypothetical protein